MSTAITTKPKEERDMTFVPFGAADSIKLSVEIVKNLIAVPTKSGQTCTDRDAMKFMMLCRAQRLNPFAGDAFLIGYDSRDGGEPSFSLITAHVAFLKRAETHPEFDGMKSGIIVVDEENRLTEIEGLSSSRSDRCWWVGYCLLQEQEVSNHPEGAAVSFPEGVRCMERRPRRNDL